MRGIKYLVDESGERSAVMIDLRHHRTLWEDFADALVAEQRRQEPRESLEGVKKRLERVRRSRRR